MRRKLSTAFLPFWVFLNLIWFGLLPVWLGISVVVFRNVTTVVLVLTLGIFLAVLINFLALFVWSVVFYFLLAQIEAMAWVENRLDRWQKRRFARWRRKSRELLERFGAKAPRLLHGSLYLIFLWPGPIAAVPALRAGRQGKLRQDLPTIFLGCLLNVIVWTFLVYGLPLMLARELGILWGWLSG